MDKMDKSEKSEAISQKKGLFNKLKSVKNIEIIIAVIAVIIMLVIYFGSKFSFSDTSAASSQSVSSADYCQKMTDELTQIISSMDGVGEAKVIINWESSVESIIAYITNTSNNSTSVTPQIISGSSGSQPIVLKEIYPKALGVIITCQGGDNVKVKLDIINAISVLLEISSDKVNVYKMKGK